MADLSRHGPLAFRYKLVGLAGLAIAAAIALACLAALATFPLLAEAPGRSVLAVAATAFVVAAPVVLVFTRLIARFAEQKRDLTAREELSTAAQQIGRYGYWHYDLLTERFTLPDNVHEPLGDFRCEFVSRQSPVWASPAVGSQPSHPAARTFCQPSTP